ncbi:MAG: response regulator transcription factor [Candidatus Obscuribacterales bacterium]|jgi:DNA-binding response OmpR family regulator|nr:response regulator transcription factor [Candidatus Obscuribacterales bacterium]
MSKILLVEDDKGLADGLVEWLEFEKNQVEWRGDGEAGLEALLNGDFDIVILDIEMPKMNGLQLCKTYRDGGGTIPIIMLTGKDTILDKVGGLDCGADDYLTKPFHPRELSARLKALARRSPEIIMTTLSAGDIEIDIPTGKVFRAGAEVRLQRMEFAVLEFLMRNAGQVYSPNDLLNAVWTAESERSPETIRTCIKKIRDKIDVEGKDSIIQNVHGVGYKVVR